MGMGLVGIGVADDSSAWFQNPAGLAALSLSPQEGKLWAHDLSASYISFGGIKSTPFDSFEAFRASWSGFKPDSKVGVGAGYMNIDDAGVGIGAGIGVGIGDTGLSVGLNVINVDPFFVGLPNETLLNAGLMYRIDQGAGKAPIRIGLTYNNVTDESYGGFLPIPSCLNLGIAWPISNDLLLALDVQDLTEAIKDDYGPGAPGMHFNGGVEFRFGAAREWAVRAGAMDIDVSAIDTFFTAGLGYEFGRYRVEGAWVSPVELTGAPFDFNSTWTIGAGMKF
jgi:hypothetical protein